MKLRALVVLCVLAVASSLAAQNPQRRSRGGYPPEMPGTRAEVYKTVGDTELRLYICEPADLKPRDKRPAIVFFFGGGWTGGSPRQFLPHCKYLASRGMVAIAADYRVKSRNGVQAVECVKDAKSAIRWVRAHAEQLGIDPHRIVAAGGSAGGHLAGATGTVEAFDEEGEDHSVSSRPNAMLLFNPALVLAPVEGLKVAAEWMERIPERTGVEPQAISPYHHITKDTPPTAIFHGQDDRTVPYVTAEAFERAMHAAGRPCKLYGYEGEGHGFFNYGRGGNKMFVATLTDADKFLTDLGYLEGEPAVTAFVEAYRQD